MLSDWFTGRNDSTSIIYKYYICCIYKEKLYNIVMQKYAIRTF